MNVMYKLKHVPTGLYYQPHKHGGSNLSKKGKIYQSARHGLWYAFKTSETDKIFHVYIAKNSIVHKLTENILVHKECKWHYNQLIAETLVSDWIIENIG